MFRGVSVINLDAKGRLAIPTKHRESLARQCEGQLVVTVSGDERCLWIYPLPAWEEIERKLVALSSTAADSQRLKRLLIGHATDCELDASGRLLVPPPLRDFAELDKRTVLIGQGNKFELWNEDKWTTRRDEWLAQGILSPDGPVSPELEQLSL